MEYGKNDEKLAALQKVQAVWETPGRRLPYFAKDCRVKCRSIRYSGKGGLDFGDKVISLFAHESTL